MPKSLGTIHKVNYVKYFSSIKNKSISENKIFSDIKVRLDVVVVDDLYKWSHQQRTETVNYESFRIKN